MIAFLVNQASHAARGPLTAALIVVSLVVFPTTACQAAEPADAIPKDALVMVVMDPMAAPLACDCVKGLAQRKYEKLAEYLEPLLKQKVVVVWSDSLVVAMRDKSDGRADIIIGKDSVVRSDAARSKLRLSPIASLTDLKGSTKQKGLFVVRASSPVTSLIDIEDYQILFGPEECDEKWSAPLAALKELDIPFAATSKSCSSCTVAAKELLEMSQGAKAVAVISSYAEPLLEGCGTIKKGDLRVIGESAEVPFVSCFANQTLSVEKQAALRAALLEMKSTEMLTIMETKSGFVPYDESASSDKK
ncbi:MAG: PhnD/SsuA/transferrin family substrate-binding protein [Pirellulaceae bacterium]|nr:PhnD/SsuA/transferrin family substrate-binding protein [Pirellulaceae bacterium]